MMGLEMDAANAWVLVQREIGDGDAILIERVNGDWPDRWVEVMAKALFYSTPTAGTFEDLKLSARRLMKRRAVLVLDGLADGGAR